MSISTRYGTRLYPVIFSQLGRRDGLRHRLCLRSRSATNGIGAFFPQLRTGLMWTVGDEGVYFGFVWIGCLASVIMTWINLRGIAFAAFIQGLITLGFVSVGLCFLVGAPWSVAFDTTTSTPMEWAGMLSVLVMVPALLVGFDVIPQSAEEINLPARRIGLLW